MPLISKPNYNQVFASQAPEQDKPAVFNNYPLGWGVESRPNNGKPTIKGFNYLQQTSDLKALWILQNGACLPYDESIEYAEGAPVLKDGVIQYKVGGGFKSRDSVTVPTYNSAADGVDPVTGVADGAYFNVRSSNNESYVDEYRNVGGVATSTGKSYPSATAIDAAIEQTDEVRELITDPVTNEIIPTRNSNKLKRENVSVWDFFTSAEYATYKAAPLAFDAHRPIQEFLTYIATNNVGVAYCSGELATSQGFVLGINGACATKTIIGTPRFIALGPIDIMLLDVAGPQFEWFGEIYLRGHSNGNAHVQANKTCRVGFQAGGTYNAARNKFTGFYVEYFQQTGVDIRNNCTFSNYGFIRGNGCGSGSFNYLDSGTFTERVDTGGDSSAGQRSTIKVSKLPPATIDEQIFINIDGRHYLVETIDRVNSTLSLQFWISNKAATTGSFYYLYGGVVAIRGSDSSNCVFERIDAQSSAFATRIRTLYNPTIKNLAAQYCLSAIGKGDTYLSASVGGEILEFYPENNKNVFLNVSLNGGKGAIKITKTNELNDRFVDPYVMFDAISPRNNAGADINTVTAQGWELNAEGKNLTWEDYPGAFKDSPASKTINIFAENNFFRIYRKNSVTVNLTAMDIAWNRMFGINTGTLIFLGTGPNNSPTGSIVFNATEGHTVNGQASVTFSGFDSNAIFSIYATISTKDYIISLVSGGVKTSSVTYDPPSLTAAGTAGDSVTTTVTLTGATPGNNVNAAFSRYNAAIEISAAVSATDTVTVKFKNTSAAAVDLASGTLAVKLI